MALNIWRGDAQPVAQVTTLTAAGTPAAGNTVSAVMNRKVITYTVQSGDTAILVAAGLYALISASALAEFGEVQWTYVDGTAVITGTAGTAGVPFVVTTAATGGGATLTAATPTASTGPNQYDDAKNWTLNALTPASDNLVIQGGSALLYGAGTLTGLTIEVRAAQTEPIGLPFQNPLGYTEYRARTVALDAPVVKIGEGAGAGIGRLFAVATAGSTWTVFASSQRESEALPAIDIGAAGTVAAVNVSGGADVGLCAQDESANRTFTAVNLAGENSRLTVGRTATVTTLDKDNGQADVYGTVTTVTNGAGAYNQVSGALTTVTSYGGLVTLAQEGTVTTATFRGASTSCDCTANGLARTFTNSEFTGGATLNDPNKTVTFTNPFVTDYLSLIGSNIGPRFSVQRS